jgi:hypothetical protein
MFLISASAIKGNCGSLKLPLGHFPPSRRSVTFESYRSGSGLLALPGAPVIYPVLYARQNQNRHCLYDRPCGAPLGRRKYKCGSDHSSCHHGHSATTGPETPPFLDKLFTSGELRFPYEVQRNKSNRVKALNPCEQELQRRDMAAIANITSNAGARSYLSTAGTTDGSLSATIIMGQQDLERKKLDAESEEKRYKMIVQAGLTLLLAVVGLSVILNKKATPTQRAMATAAMGIALGYWFK